MTDTVDPGTAAPALDPASGEPVGLAGRRAAIARLEAALAQTPSWSRPHEHATLAYRLGLAYAETAPGDPTPALRRALACFEIAADLFDPRFDPVEHARTLNLAGAMHRSLGDPARAADLFDRAVKLLEGRDRDDERGAVLNNLGLARTETGDQLGAVAAFDAAIDLFEPTSAEGHRARLACLHNRGQAHAARDDEAGLRAALADYRLAAGEADRRETPYHAGLIHHSAGVAWSRRADLAELAHEPDATVSAWLEEATVEFRSALLVFTRDVFPFQHALAKYNLGNALLRLGGVNDLRRALACFEDAVALLDPRLHSDQWRRAFAGLQQAEQALEVLAPATGRGAHFVALASELAPSERSELLRERLLRYLDLPAPQRRAAMTELALASAQLVPDRLTLIIESELEILMTLPPTALEAGLLARLDAHGRLGDGQEEANRRLDRAIGAVLGAPQRIFVRDFLSSLGWERP